METVVALVKTRPPGLALETFLPHKIALVVVADEKPPGSDNLETVLQIKPIRPLVELVHP